MNQHHVCLVCGSSFFPLYSQSRVCSEVCRIKRKLQRDRKRSQNPEVREKEKRRKRNPEYRERQRIYDHNRAQNPEYRERRRMINKKYREKNGQIPRQHHRGDTDHHVRGVYCVAETPDGQGPCKIGVADDVSKRLSSLRGGNWRKLYLVWIIEMRERDAALNVEQHCLSRFRPDIYGGSDNRTRLQSEWVAASSSEIFAWAKKLADVYNERECEAA